MGSTTGKLGIWNMALGYIGSGRMVASDNEHTPEAIQCGLFWDRARRAALRDFPYNFAQRRSKLAETVLPEEYKGSWRVAYAMPNKLLKLQRIHAPNELSDDDMHKTHPFKIVNDDQVSIILCNIYQATADYTFDCTDISLWDELFVMACARQLAIQIAVPLLKNNSNKVSELVQMYQQILPKAEGLNSSEERVKKAPLDSWLAVRGGWV